MIFDYVVSHQAEFWLVCGFIMLTIEVITGFTTGFFLFGGIGALISGLLMSFGLLPETWIAGISCTGISSGLAAMLLWKPLKSLQDDSPAGKDNSSDLVGYAFVLDTSIEPGKPGNTDYSGISWKVEIDPQSPESSIESGQRVVVTSVEVGTFKVKPIA